MSQSSRHGSRRRGGAARRAEWEWAAARSTAGTSAHTVQRARRQRAFNTQDPCRPIKKRNGKTTGTKGNTRGGRKNKREGERDRTGRRGRGWTGQCATRTQGRARSGGAMRQGGRQGGHQGETTDTSHLTPPNTLTPPHNPHPSNPPSNPPDIDRALPT